MKTGRHSPQAELYVRTTAPGTGDDSADGFRVGDEIFNSATGIRYACLDNTAGYAVWRPVNSFLHSGYQRPAYPQAQRTVMSLFDGGVPAEWSKGSGTEVAAEATIYEMGTGSIKVRSNNATFTRAVKTAAFDLSGKTHFYLKFKAADKTTITSMALHFVTDSGASRSYRYSFSVSYFVTGWNYYAIPKADFVEVNTPTGWNNVAAVWIDVTSAAGQDGIIYPDALIAYNTQLTRGAVVFTFDDLKASHLSQAAPYLDKYGWPGVLFAQTQGVGSGLTWANIIALQNIHGWEIGCHGHDHADFSAKTSDQRVLDMRRALAEMARNGVLRPLSFTFPFGTFNDDSIADVEKYFAFIRPANKTPRRQPWPVPNYRMLQTLEVTASTVLATITDQITAAETNKDVAVIGFHELVAAGATGNQCLISTFQSAVDFAATKNVDVTSFRQLSQRSV